MLARKVQRDYRNTSYIKMDAQEQLIILMPEQYFYYMEGSSGNQTAPTSPLSFSLRRLHSSGPALQAALSSPSSPSSDLAPRFNHDSRHFTPAFLLPMDQPKVTANHQAYHRLHDRKVEQVEEEKREMLVPRPSRNNSFCCICKVGFEDYLTHTHSHTHQTLLQQSQYRTHIEELCRSVGNPPPVVESKKAKKRLPKTKSIHKLPTLRLKHSLSSGRETSAEEPLLTL